MDYSGKKHSRGGFSKDFNGGSGGKKFGSGRSFGGSGGGSGKGRDSAKLTLHQAICSDCGSQCQVPFKPSSDKPVFCRNCFKSKGDASPKRSDGSGRTFEISNEQFKILNAKLDKILEALDT